MISDSFALRLVYLTFNGTNPLTLLMFLPPKLLSLHKHYTHTHKYTSTGAQSHRRKDTNTNIDTKKNNNLVLAYDLYSSSVSVHVCLESFLYKTRFKLLTATVLKIAKSPQNLRFLRFFEIFCLFLFYKHNRDTNEHKRTEKNRKRIVIYKNIFSYLRNFHKPNLLFFN